jgi:hypothetical protein
MTDITTLNSDELIHRYITIRDAKAEKEAEHKKGMERYNKALARIEEILMARLEADGEDSKKTPHGTCYKTTKTTAKVADRDAFLEYVKENDAWNFIESRVNAKEVEKYVGEHDELPPGVTTTRFTKVGVRRAPNGE